MKRFLLGCAFFALYLPTLVCAAVVRLELCIYKSLWPEA